MIPFLLALFLVSVPLWSYSLEFISTYWEPACGYYSGMNSKPNSEKCNFLTTTNTHGLFEPLTQFTAVHMNVDFFNDIFLSKEFSNSKTRAILDISSYIFSLKRPNDSNSPFQVDKNAFRKLLFLKEQINGKLDKVLAFYILDEPDNHFVSKAMMEEVIEIVNGIFPGIPTYATYSKDCFETTSKEGCNLESKKRGIPKKLDWIGFDWYMDYSFNDMIRTTDGKIDQAGKPDWNLTETTFFYNRIIKTVKSLKQKLAENQRMVLIPETTDQFAKKLALSWDPKMSSGSPTLDYMLNSRLQRYFDLAELEPRIIGLDAFVWVEYVENTMNFGARRYPMTRKNLMNKALSIQKTIPRGPATLAKVDDFCRAQTGKPSFEEGLPFQQNFENDLFNGGGYFFEWGSNHVILFARNVEDGAYVDIRLPIWSKGTVIERQFINSKDSFLYKNFCLTVIKLNLNPTLLNLISESGLSFWIVNPNSKQWTNRAVFIFNSNQSLAVSFPLASAGIARATPHAFIPHSTPEFLFEYYPTYVHHGLSGESTITFAVAHVGANPYIDVRYPIWNHGLIIGRPKIESIVDGLFFKDKRYSLVKVRLDSTLTRIMIESGLHFWLVNKEPNITYWTPNPHYFRP